MKKFFSSESFYKIISVTGNFVVDATETVAKEWLGTVIGQRFLKWFTDIIVTRFFDTIAEPFMRVAAVRMGYYYDRSDAVDKFKKLKKAEDSNDVDEYLRTLNDVFRK